MLVSLKGVGKNFGAEEILKNIELTVNEGDHIGLIGPNGTGKSTLLKIICGLWEADGGDVFKKSSLTIGYLKQDLGLDPDISVYEETLKASGELVAAEEKLARMLDKISETTDEAELSKLNEKYHTLSEWFEANKGYYYKALTASTLKGLGFDETAQSRCIRTLSGGQKMRVALAKMLIERPELMLLDEPTNYLDLDSIAWLESTLSAYPSAYIIASHDRYFLDKTVGIIWETGNLGIQTYRGNYSAYLQQHEERFRAQMKEYHDTMYYIERQKEVIRKLKSFNREKSIKRAESREKLLAKIEVPEKPKDAKVSKITLHTSELITKNALRLVELSVGYNGKALLSGLDMKIYAGEKIGICGANATGKSTFFKTLMGSIPPISGEIILGSGVVPMHFKQEHEDLDPNNSILDELVIYSGLDVVQIRSLLGSLLFTEDDVYKKIGVLSGGEKSRVAVAKLMLTKSSLLLLDEPTNHLDIASKEVFESAMASYEGTILVVSHDRYLLDHIATRMIFIHDGRAYIYNEPYAKANELFEADLALGALAAREVKVPEVEAAVPLEAPTPKKEVLSKNRRRECEARVSAIEARLSAIEAERAEIELEINSEGFYRDSLQAAEVIDHYDELGGEYDRLESEWIDLNYLLEEN